LLAVVMLPMFGKLSKVFALGFFVDHVMAFCITRS